MLERGLNPCATLLSFIIWELLSPLAALGGWRNRDIAEWFADFAEATVGRIGDRMFSTATINEPWYVSWLSHFLGRHAPGLRDIRATARAIEVMRDLGMNTLVIVVNNEWATPADETSAAARAADLYICLLQSFLSRRRVQGPISGACSGGVGTTFAQGVAG